MSGSQSTEKAEKRGKVAEWFNNLFRTKLETDADKLLELMKSSNDNEVRGNTTFFYSRGGLQAEVQKKLGKEPKYVKLGDLSATYWCDVPKRLWTEFQNDGAFLAQLYGDVNTLTDKLVGEWAKRAKVWEISAAEADAKGDKKGVQHAVSEFEKDCRTLQKECETVAIEDIASFFQTKVKAYSDYKKYKIKAGAKLAFTFVGIIVAVAALSTAATPAAPATLVPAIIGLVAAVASVGKQIRDLSLAAEDVAKELEGNLLKVECNYLDEKGKPKKKAYRASDMASGFVGGLTGGWTEVKFPSVNSLMGLVGTHKSKLDGLDVRLHEMGNNINAVIDSMDLAHQVLENNDDALTAALKRKPGDPLIKKAQKVLADSQDAFAKLKNEFYTLFDKIPELMKRINDGLANNKIWGEKLEEINKALGSKNWAVAGSIFATLALFAIGFSSGLPSNFAESVTTPLGGAITGADLLREYTPDVMEKLLG